MARKILENQDHGNIARITNLPAANSGDQPVRKAEFDAALLLRDYIEEPVRAVADANVNIAAPGANMDTVALAANDRVLLTAQTTPSQNGIYLWQGAALPLQRTADVYEAGTVVIAGPDGTSHKNSAWLQTTKNPVVDTTSLTFVQFGSSVSAGTGLAQAGTVISLATPVTVANGGTGGGSQATARANLAAAGVYSADFGDGAANSFTINHNLGNQWCALSVINKTTGLDEECTVSRTNANQLVLSSEAWTGAPPAANQYRVCCVG